MPVVRQVHPNIEERAAADGQATLARRKAGYPLLGLEQLEAAAGALVPQQVRHVMGRRVPVALVLRRDGPLQVQRAALAHRHHARQEAHIVPEHVRVHLQRRQLAVGHACHHATHHGLQRIEVLLAVHHQLHQVGRVGGGVELLHACVHVQPCCARRFLQRAQVSCGKLVKGVSAAGQVLPQLHRAPGVAVDVFAVLAVHRVDLAFDAVGRYEGA
mmetsp:Transcript_13064/g.33565  ORF Transcript_13064/g.33565 Transcript_13064/m.33565 type:complete len:215 (+) Transcript_13064:2357-3001(+)